MNNEELTFEEIYKQFYNPLMMYAQKNLRNQSEAEDIVQDVFVGVLEWKNKNPTKPISYKILYGRVIDGCRKANERLKETIPLEENETQEDY